MDPTGTGPGPDPEIDLKATERRLAGLRPRPVALDRDRLLFEAGRASALGARRGRLAQAPATILALVAVGLGGLLARERSERRGLEIRLAAEPRNLGPLPRSPEPPRPLEPESYLALSRRFQSEGLDPAPSPRRAADPPPEAKSPPLAPLRVRGAWGHAEL